LWLPVALAAAIAVGFFLYSPAMNGPFLFDDAGLPFAKSSLKDGPLSAWVLHISKCKLVADPSLVPEENAVGYRSGYEKAGKLPAIL
jgi:hypothetical protein